MLMSKPLLKMSGTPSNLLHVVYIRKKVVHKYDFPAVLALSCLFIYFSFELWPLNFWKLTSCIKTPIECRNFFSDFRMTVVFVHCLDEKKLGRMRQ